MKTNTIWVTWKESGVLNGLRLDMKHCTKKDLEELELQADAGTFTMHDSLECMHTALRSQEK